MKPNKSKQFSAKSHSRSASYKNLNKLGKTEDATRPILNRSKSSDGIPLNKRNRSFTKLKPLTRTRSHQNVPSNNASTTTTTTTLMPIDQGDGDDDEKDDEEDEVEEEEVETFSDEEGQKILSYKAPITVGNTDKKSFNGEPLKINTDDSDLTGKTPSNNLTKANGDINQVKDDLKDLQIEQPIQKPFFDPEKLKLTQIVQQPQDQQELVPEQDDNGLSQYYQNMILSQSTGLVRDFSDQPFQNSLLQDTIKNQDPNSLKYIHSNDHINSNISKSSTFSTYALRHFTQQQQHSQQQQQQRIPSSNESSSALSFRVDRSQPREVQQRRKQQQHSQQNSFSSSKSQSINNTPNNFNQFLQSNNSNIETRTQQKLWLQRENSLLDFTNINYNNNTHNIQVRREFEKISREYQNVRRFINPILESVKRVNVDKPVVKHGNNINDNTSNNKLLNNSTFESIKNDPNIQNKLLSLWVDGDNLEASNGANQQPHNISQQQQSHHHQHQQQQQQRQQQYQQYQQQQQQYQQQQNSIQRPSLLPSHQSYLRSPVAPSTRAVDRAIQNSPENKRIDLAAIRLQEAEQLQKLA